MHLHIGCFELCSWVVDWWEKINKGKYDRNEILYTSVNWCKQHDKEFKRAYWRSFSNTFAIVEGASNESKWGSSGVIVQNLNIVICWSCSLRDLQSINITKAKDSLERFMLALVHSDTQNIVWFGQCYAFLMI